MREEDGREGAQSESQEGPRPLGRLLADSFNLTLAGLPAYAAIVAAGLAPGYLALAAAFGMVGFTGSGEEFIKAAADAGRYGDLALIAAAGVLNLAFRGLAFIALAVALLARLRREELGAAGAYGRAVDFIVPLAVAEIRVFLWVLGGLFLLVVPGIVLAIRYCLTHWAVLAEHVTGRDALDRSKEIVVAHMGKVLGNLLVAGFVVLAVGLMAAFAAVLPLTVMGLAAPSQDAVGHMLVIDLYVNVIKGVVGVWGVAFSVLLYSDLAELHPFADQPAAEEVASPS